MIQNFEKYINNIKKRGSSNRGSIYAQIIKGERNRQNKTLEEVAKGICSISYLCKMENFSVTPPMDFVKTLFERMNLDYNAVSDEDFESSLNSALNYYYNDSDKLEDMTNSLSQYHASPTIKLIICLNNLRKRQYDQLLEDLDYLDNIKEGLGGLDALTLVYIALKYYVDNFYFQKAYQYLKCLDFFDIENKYLKFLILEANLIVSFHMKNYQRFNMFYECVDSLLYSGYDLEKKLEAKMLLNIFKCQEYPYVVLEDIDASTYEGKFVNYYKYIVLIKCGLHKNVLQEIYKENAIKSAEILGLVAYIAYKTKDRDVLNDLLEKINKFEFTDYDKIHKDFVFFILENELNINKLEIKEYLKREFVPLVNKVYHFLYTDVYMEVYLKILGSISQYKEAYNFMLDYFTIKF